MNTKVSCMHFNDVSAINTRCFLRTRIVAQNFVDVRPRKINYSRRVLYVVDRHGLWFPRFIASFPFTHARMDSLLVC